MRASAVDARRYVWCRSQATWLMGPPAAQWLEDMEGAVASGQDGLARHVAQRLAEDCAVMLALSVSYQRPVPTANMRGAWALDRIEGHPLRDECWSLMRGSQETSAGLLERCARLQQSVHEVVGNVPDALTPEGYFPALSLAREWLKLVDIVDEGGFLPAEWTRR
jgi:hypothetical protein